MRRLGLGAVGVAGAAVVGSELTEGDANSQPSLPPNPALRDHVLTIDKHEYKPVDLSQQSYLSQYKEAVSGRWHVDLAGFRVRVERDIEEFANKVVVQELGGDHRHFAELWVETGHTIDYWFAPGAYPLGNNRSQMLEEVVVVDTGREFEVMLKTVSTDFSERAWHMGVISA